MKKLLTALLVLLGVTAHGAVIFPIPSASDFIGNFPTNYNQTISNLNAAISAAGVAQSPFTNDLDAAGNSIENLDAPEITNTTIFIRLWGTNVLSLQGTTNVALNGVSLMDGPSDGNTPQGPWTNVVSMNAFAATGGDYIQVTNQIAFRVGTNLLAVQGWPDATNLAWNGAALINVSGGGGGGPYLQGQGTNNIAPTNHANTFGLADIGQTIGGGVGNATTNANYATVNGGQANTIAAGATHSTVGGGSANDIAASVTYATVGGGNNNDITSVGTYAVIGGGFNNVVSQDRGTIAGGWANTVSAAYASIGGGRQNTAAAQYAHIGGGYLNDALSGGSASAIGGGYDNDVSSYGSVIGGGYLNKILGGEGYSFIGGGGYDLPYNNMISNSFWASILGGAGNRAEGTNVVVIGSKGSVSHNGSIVISAGSYTNALFASTAGNQVAIRAPGGVWIAPTYSTTPIRQPMYLGSYTNVNPATIVPTMQMDWYYDQGSNYVMRCTDGTTNGWAHLP